MALTPGSELVPYDEPDGDGDEETILLNVHEHDGYDSASRTGPAFDAPRKDLYVKAIRRGARRNAAAEAVGVGARTVWGHLRDDDEFRQRVLDAEEARVDEVEAAMYETALRGNVVAQQVILYNKRSDEWADMRQLHARLEAAKQQDSEATAEERKTAKQALRDKLAELRAAVVTEVVVEETADLEPDADETDDDTGD